MKGIILILVFSISSFNILFAQDEDQKVLIKNVIQSAYVDGLCNNADAEAVNKGFHPGFNLLGVGSGNIMWTYPIHSWMENAKNGKKKGLKYSFQNEFTTIKFVFVDVAGTAAVAKVEFYEGNVMTSIDYLSLLKFEDGWKIVSKTFYSIPQAEK